MSNKVVTTKEENATEDKLKMEIAGRFKLIRTQLLEKAQKRQDIIAIIEVSDTSYYNYEIGRSHIPSDVLAKIRDRLGISTEWLLGGFPLPYALNEKGLELIQAKFGRSFDLGKYIVDYAKELKAARKAQVKGVQPAEEHRRPNDEARHLQRRKHIRKIKQ